MSGWVPMDALWWPSIAEGLALPWNREAVLMDLRWWDDQVRMKRIAERPGRITLQERWGWTQWAYRQVCLDEETWANPLHSTDSARPPPAATKANAENTAVSAHRPPTARPPPAATKANAENTAVSARPPPVGRPTRGEDIEQNSEALPPNPRPSGTGELTAGKRWDWVADLAERTLREAPDQAEQLADKWVKPDANTVRDVYERAKGILPKSKLDGTRPKGTPFPGCPASLKQRDVERGLPEGVARWRASQRIRPDDDCDGKPPARRPAHELELETTS